jgi:hypothetical protein
MKCLIVCRRWWAAWVLAALLCPLGAQAAGSCATTSAAFGTLASGTPFGFVTASGEKISLVGLHLTADALAQHPETLPLLQKRLTSLLQDGPLTLAYAKPEPDAAGFCLAQVTNGKGVWVQERILLDGIAVYTNKPVADPYMGSLLLAEQQARRGQTGLWQYKQLLVRDTRSINAPQYNNTYQIVEGPIRFVRDLNRVIMTCLDDDPWKSVCLVVLRDVYFQLKGQGLDLMSPAAQNIKIRARGEVNYREDAGLKLFIDKPELIQVIDAATTADAGPVQQASGVVR